MKYELKEISIIIETPLTEEDKEEATIKELENDIKNGETWQESIKKLGFILDDIEYNDWDGEILSVIANFVNEEQYEYK